MQNYIATRLESSATEFKELQSREQALSAIMRDQVTLILNREAMKSFEESHKSWRKNPQFGLCLLIGTHFGTNFIFNTWYGLYEDLMTSTGPSLERMIDIVMIEGHDPRFQYINLNARWLMTRYICMQKDRRAAVESWMQYSRMLCDSNSLRRFDYYLNAPVTEIEARKELGELLRIQTEKWQKINNLKLEKFRLLADQIASASEHFSFGRSSVSSLHRQIRQRLSKVQAESSRLEMSQIRTHSHEDQSNYTPTDFLDLRMPLAKTLPTIVNQPEPANSQVINSEKPIPDSAAPRPETPGPEAASAFSSRSEQSADTSAALATPEIIVAEKTIVEIPVVALQTPSEFVDKLPPPTSSNKPGQVPVTSVSANDPRGPVPEFIEEMKRISMAKWERRRQQEREKQERENQVLIKKAASILGESGSTDHAPTNRENTTWAQQISIGKRPVGKGAVNASSENVRRPEKGHVGPTGHHSAVKSAPSEAKTPSSASKAESVSQSQTSGVNRQVTDTNRPPPIPKN